MSKPTEEQVKKFWEWCGFRYGERGNLAGWLLNGELPYFKNLPDLDLNNLFKWAAPKLINDIGTMGTYFLVCSAMYEAIEKVNFSEKKAEYNGKPALALFWAIWEVIGGKQVG